MRLQAPEAELRPFLDGWTFRSRRSQGADDDADEIYHRWGGRDVVEALPYAAMLYLFRGHGL